MKFKVGDKVKVMGSDKIYEIENITQYDKDTRRYKFVGVSGWHVVGVELADDPLATKIEERNSKTHSEKVNSPSHYTKGDIEVIDIIKQLTQGYEPFEAYLVGNAIKYLARANFKENKQQDLEKAQWHINKLLEREE